MPSGNSSPIINRVCLKMSLENIVKDIPAISDSDWTYGDLMVSDPLVSNHVIDG